MKKTAPNIIWWLWGSALSVVVILLYWKGLHGPFLFDDLQSIDTAPLDPFSWRKFFEISVQNNSGPLGRPLSIASFALNNYFFGMTPLSYKVINLILHLCNGLAAGIFIYLLLSLTPTAKRLALLTAFITTTVWLLHPLQVSTVLYAVQRMTLLCHFFILSGLSIYLLGRRQLILHKRFALPLMASSLLVFFPLAVLSKETGVLFPLYLFCIEYFILQFHGRTPQQTYWLTHTHRLLSLGIILGAALYYWHELPKFLSIYGEKGYTVVDRLLTESKVLVFYLKLIFLPSLNQMGLYHDDFPLSTHFDSDVALSSLILIGCIGLIIWGKRRAPILSFGLAWFFISQLVESTALPLELVFEHRNYLASLGLLLIPSYYFVFFFHRFTPFLKKFSVVSCLLLLILLMGLTTLRSIIWSATDKLLVAESLHHPLSARVHIELGNWFLKEQQYELAFAELEQAQQLEPANLGILLHEMVVFCCTKEIPDKLYQQALSKIKTAAITPYVVTALDILVTNIFNQKCNANKDKVIDIIQAAYGNPFLVYRPRYKATLYHLEAGLQLLHQQYSRCRFLLLESFHTYPNRFEPLIEKAYLELNHGMIASAQTTINLLHFHEKSMYAPREKISDLDRMLLLAKMKAAEQAQQHSLAPDNPSIHKE